MVYLLLLWKKSCHDSFISFIPPFPTSSFSHRKNYDNSVKLMEDLPWRYNEQGWTLIENTLLVNYAACQRELNQIRKYP